MSGKVSSIVESLRAFAVSSGDKIAVLDSKNRLLYAELWNRAKSFAEYLNCDCGVRPGDIVVVRTSQEVWYPVVYFGIHLAKATTLGLEKNVSTDTVADLCKKTNCSVLISNSPNNPEFSRDGMSYIDSSKIMSLTDKVSDTEVSFPDESAVADIMYTTGTTGKSKGVCISHISLVNNAAKLIDGFGFKNDTVIIVPGPLNHGGALRKLHTTILNGSTMYILNGMVSVKAFYDALDCDLGRLACCLPPSAVRVLLSLTGDKISAYAGTIDFIESASAPLPETDRVILGNYLPDTRIIIQYGSTECGGLTVYDCNHERGLAGCVGRPMPGSEVSIMDDQDKAIDSDAEHIGIIASRGNAQMEYYFNDYDLTAEVMRDGFVFTSDMGYFDNYGRLFVTGRKDDVINVGGLKVAPSEVENVALGYPGMLDCVCTAYHNAILGNVPKMYVVMGDGALFDESDIIRFLSKRLEKYKVPLIVEKTDNVRRLFNGKIDRKSYRA